MAKEAGGTGTRAGALYARLRADVFTGRLPAGRRLKFPELCEDYNASVGVVREALTRLTAERLVAFTAHQGFSVAPLSANELTDVTCARVEVEALTFRLSIQQGDDQWEADVLAAGHLLNLQEREARDGVRGDQWYEAHEAFHAALTAGCGSRRFVEISHGLRAETELYRRWAAPFLADNDRDPIAEHNALAQAALNRDSGLGAELLRDHIAFTSQMLLVELEKTSNSGSSAG